MTQLDGFLNIHKPAGITSHDVVQRIRDICKIQKVGHGGTLDPFATGVLVIAVGSGTKFLRFLQLEPKEYRAKIVFGIGTDTMDHTGRIIFRQPVSGLSRKNIRSTLSGFVGEINQVPPIYSAIKSKGVPLYRLARMGKEVTARPRKVTVLEIELEDFFPGEHPEAIIKVGCSAGTYIRSLASDIAKALKTEGHLTVLTRTRAGTFELEEAIGFEGLSLGLVRERVITLEQGLEHHSYVRIKKRFLSLIANGSPIQFNMVEESSNGIKSHDLLRVIDHQSNFLGIAESRTDLTEKDDPARIVVKPVRML